MLDFIRRGVKSIFAKILLGLLVASFAVWGIGDAFSGFSLTSPVASVGERDVTVDTYSTSLQRLQSQRSQERRTVVSLSDLRRSGEAEGLLQRLIRDAALGAELDALGVTAPDAAVAEAITTLPAFQGPDGEFSAPAYRQLLANQGLSTAEFEALQRDEIGRAVVAQAVAGSVIAPPGVVARIAAYEGARREVAVMTLTPDMAEVPAAPDDATLAAHLEANPDRFREPERKHGRLLHIDIRALAAGIDVDADAARAEYEASRSQFVTEGTAEIDQLPFPDLAAAEAAAAAIAGGKPFEEAVADRGLDPAAVDLGSVTAADLPAPVAEAVFALDAPGIAAPVETLLGAALIRVRSITPTITIPFEAVAEQMALRAAERVASARIAELAGTVEDLRAEGRTLEEIAEAVDAAVIRAIPGRAADNTVEGGAPAEGVIARNDMAAELDEAIDGEERDLVRLGNGGYVLVVIDRIEPAFVPDLDAIRDRVAEDWALEQRLAALEARGARIAGTISDSTSASLASIAAGLARPVKAHGPYRRVGDLVDLPAALIDATFDLEAGGATSLRLPDGSGVMVAEVTAVPPLDPDFLAAATAEIERGFATTIAQDQVARFTETLLEHHGATIDRETIQTLFERLGANEARAY